MPTLSLSKNQGSAAESKGYYHIGGHYRFHGFAASFTSLSHLPRQLVPAPFLLARVPLVYARGEPCHPTTRVVFQLGSIGPWPLPSLILAERSGFSSGIRSCAAAISQLPKL